MTQEPGGIDQTDPKYPRSWPLIIREAGHELIIVIETLICYNKLY